MFLAFSVIVRVAIHIVAVVGAIALQGETYQKTIDDIIKNYKEVSARCEVQVKEAKKRV